MRKIKKRYRYKAPKPRAEKGIVYAWSYTALGRMIVEGVNVRRTSNEN